MRRAILIALAACGSGGDADQPPPRAAPPVDEISIAMTPPVPALVFDVAPPADKVVSIGRGETWSCVARASGGVDCWGTLGTGRPEPMPRRIPGVTDAIAVANDGKCVLRRTGEVACFAGDRLELETVPGLAHVTQISTGASDCVLHDDGGVSCNGAHRVPQMTDAIAVGASRDRVCVVRRGGQLVCKNPHDDEAPWIAVAGLPPVRLFAMEIAAANAEACAVLEQGEVRCFNITEYEGPLRAEVDSKLADFDGAQLANATALSVLPQYGSHEGHPFVLDAIVGGKVVRYDLRGTHALPDLTDASLLASGCAVRAQGSVVCWGSNAGGAAGQPTTIGRYRRPPTKVLGAGNVVQVSMSDGEAWARTGDGKLFQWGEHGQGWAIEVPLPPGAGAATAVAVSEHGDVCAIAGGGSVWCRTGDFFTKKLDKGAISIAGMSLGVMALRADGTFAPIPLREKSSWSDGDFPALTPAPGAIALLAYSFRWCVRFDDGAVACFEGNEWSKVPNVRGATDLAPRYVTCAVRSGSLACWGYDIGKPLAKPQKGPPVTDALAIAGAEDDVCVVRSRGRVTCYRDYNFRSQDVIAAGAIDVELAPKAPTGCAIMRDRTVMCWGKNTSGILGDGSVAFTDRPLGVRL